MEETQRRALRRGRARLVAELRVAPLWDPLEDRGLFTRTMVEELQSAGSRGDQARQLVIDLETRGKQAFPLFLSILRDTGQGDLADMLMKECQCPLVPPQLAELRPVELELRGKKHNKNVNLPERLSIPVQVESERPRTPPAPALGLAVEKRNRDLVYELKADPCGHCLILNNVDFSRDSDLSTRVGSNVDCKKLEKRFKSLSFDVLTRQNLKAQEMVSELQKLAQQDHGALDCCIVVILSHGCQTSHNQFPGGVYGTDGKPIPIEKIVNYFNGSNCPSLRGKPKLFFIQACGGEQRDRGFVVDCDSPGDEAPGGALESDATPFRAPVGGTDEPDAVASLPTPSDILVSYSTFPGFVSWRDASSGSWYVETLDRVLEQYAHTEDLLSMLLRVADAVSAKGRYKQIPGCFNFLRKKFFFTCK
ncbi:PREDICTED: caspase-9 isoform X3 [Calidris pugnax]|uniref:caspase-9 isoform X1 n=1 Tax=Calidris pugnax TaxID=198806 RepID=UPI00071E07DD|nr:PREDICTED: caspase-9 isoform X1 [Calidris pugnax]XP_014807538.1 PREDICTED: caspase-9 isoform X2 [Calidris pugnax]XP_014807539.1 PREDICTED: caspase-9 isoform X3 [Calidris pugnax]